MAHKVAPSLLAADFAHLYKSIEIVNNSEADWFHCDIMDGVFVPNISFGFPILEHVKKYAQKPMDVHLMIVQPEKFITQFRDVGADILNVHYEASTHLHRTLQQISDAGMKPAVTLNPHTPVHVLNDIIQEIYMVLLMSVNPGYGGQSFIANSLNKIRDLKELIEEKNADTLIEIDGGVDLKNAAELVKNGTDVLVAGSSVFNSKDPIETIRGLKNV